MTLALSTAAVGGVPEDALGPFDEVCRGRGLDGVELVLDDAGDPGPLSERVRAAGLRVVALRRERLPATGDALRSLAVCSARLSAPVSIPERVVDRTSLPALAALFEKERGRLLLAHGTALDVVVELASAVSEIGSPSLGLAWDLRPSERMFERGAVLLAAHALLGLVRFHGGGPEQNGQDGLGIGQLIMDLAASRQAVPLVLCPSSDAELPRWRSWLASRKSAGCGHAHDAREILVDVRGVEPKDRLETILSAYRALGRGATLRLTVDHDPSCMFYMLEATEPAGSFAFHSEASTEDGLEVWRAEVQRR